MDFLQKKLGAVIVLPASILFSIIVIIALSILALFSYSQTSTTITPSRPSEADTEFTSQFSRDRFDAITNGMSEADVTVLVGPPFSVAPDTVGGADSCWNYSKDKKPAAQNTWYQYSVCFKNDQVVRTGSIVHFD